MKNSLDHSSQHVTTIKHELCSEKCDTCFKNRGCIYDQYLLAAILNMEIPQLKSNMNNPDQQTLKEHNITGNPVAA